jgi:hypothetical protein
MNYKIQIKKSSRKGNNRLKAIIVLRLKEYATHFERAALKEAIDQVTADKNGIIWLPCSHTVEMKVYTIK